MSVQCFIQREGSNCCVLSVAAAMTPSVHHRPVPARPDPRLDRFDDISSPLMPPPCATWQLALRNVTRGEISLQRDGWRYWLPSPSLFANEQNLAKALRRAEGWLLIRPAWLDLLAATTSAQLDTVGLRLEQWKVVLDVQHYPPQHPGGEESRTVVDRRACIAHVESLVGGSWPTDTALARWAGGQTATTIRILCEIIWEVCCVGFRLDLTALDRVLVPEEQEDQRRKLIQQVFGPLLFSYVSDTDAQTGLASGDISFRVASIEGLRQVIRRWPRATHQICCMRPINSSCAEADLLRCEQQLCNHFCQQFAESAGRAPIVPRLWPSRRSYGASAVLYTSTD